MLIDGVIAVLCFGTGLSRAGRSSTTTPSPCRFIPLQSLSIAAAATVVAVAAAVVAAAVAVASLMESVHIFSSERALADDDDDVGGAGGGRMRSGRAFSRCNVRAGMISA